ncbi:hypothetical protein E2P86_03900 [Sphingobacterium psychroaquaticum]|uniref:translocation and assembly module lipoprotein TamL n=1 Tax=Sphingobacterium psychroaquaticum TaxID=561061 RepID=UPI00106D072F|nr:BamA/TamA family outer membrane protein [Sphingobacterium psychroaquaticum]QBQ40337.1 hypothetical protein E2P86_03900 [Sphingobacterium psychroaquaticum]
MIKKYSFFVYASITLLSVFFASCRSAKYLEEDQALVTAVDMEGVPAEFNEQVGAYISNEIKPNSRLNLWVYNFFNTKKGKYKKDKIRNVGEAPHILDSSLVDFSAKQMMRYLQTKGYFNAQVDPSVKLQGKKAKVHFMVTLGAPFFVQDVKHQVPNTEIEAIYVDKVRPFSKVKSGKRFDVSDLLDEREQLYDRLKENGYFDYLRQYMRVGVDTLVQAQRANLLFEVQRPSDSVDHKVYYINKVAVRVLQPAESMSNRKPKKYEDEKLQLSFEDQTGRFKLKPISRYVYLRPGDRYNMTKENMSYDRLYEMNGFRNVKINYEKVDSNKLNVQYSLTPRPVMANQVEGEFTFSSGMSGFNVGNTFSHRNVFGGAEQLEVKMRYGLLFDPRLGGSLKDKIFNTDFQVGVNLVVPRLMTPFETSSVGTYGLPRTTYSTNLQIFQQDQTYSNRYLVNNLNYIWHSSARSQHSLTPISLEYRLGRLNDDFAEKLKEEGYGLYVETNNRAYFGLGAQYVYTRNAAKLLKKENFNFFRGSIETSGNLLNVASNLFKFSRSSTGERQLFNVTYLQYIKSEVDYRWYKYLGGNKQLVLRFNSGIAVPYGNNSELLIFEKRFFAGGINGIRAWQARTLGPGNYNRESVPEHLRLNLRNLDQLGELKIEANAEYRFRLVNNFLGAKLNGATFIDAGNIWRLKEDESVKGGEFRADKFLSQIALGTGIGLRLDMDYFVIRLDTGLKLKDPQFQGSKQWVITEIFDAKAFKRAFNETHKPDRYSFVQYNFSVGLPF